jgi:hypothetical protein
MKLDSGELPLPSMLTVQTEHIKCYFKCPITDLARLSN